MLNQLLTTGSICASISWNRIVELFLPLHVLTTKQQNNVFLPDDDNVSCSPRSIGRLHYYYYSLTAPYQTISKLIHSRATSCPRHTLSIYIYTKYIYYILSWSNLDFIFLLSSPRKLLVVYILHPTTALRPREENKIKESVKSESEDALTFCCVTTYIHSVAWRNGATKKIKTQKLK